jgi:dTDP-glucose pyrophosphorylase
MWGIIPAAGIGSRIQPLAFSKELLPVGSRRDGDIERPRAVSEYLVERMILGGADKICFVVSPGKSDIVEYYGGRAFSVDFYYAVQPRPFGLCDAIFRALPLVHRDEAVTVGLPDTVWFPEDALNRLDSSILSFLLFPVEQPELFDVVLTDEQGGVREIRVKQADIGCRWIWGAFKMPGAILADLFDLWQRRGRSDAYIGTLVNAYLAEGGKAIGVPAGQSYVDVGTVNGYREAVRLLTGHPAEENQVAGARRWS